MLKTTTLITTAAAFSLMTFLIILLPNGHSNASTANNSDQAQIPSLNLGQFESGLSSINDAYWLRTEDRVAGGSSLAEVSHQSELQVLNVQATVNQGFEYPWAGAALFSKQVIDIQAYSKISFDVQGTAGDYLIMTFSGKMGRVPPMQSFTVNDQWQTITLPLSQFRGLDSSDFKGLAIVAGPASGSFEYSLDNVKLH